METAFDAIVHGRTGYAFPSDGASLKLHRIYVETHRTTF